MTPPSIERGDTFYVTEDKLRGHYFTCVGPYYDDGFYAGDTNGRMWRFTYAPGIKYDVEISEDRSWRPKGSINAESIIKE